MRFVLPLRAVEAAYSLNGMSGGYGDIVGAPPLYTVCCLVELHAVAKRAGAGYPEDTVAVCGECCHLIGIVASNPEEVTQGRQISFSIFSSFRSILSLMVGLTQFPRTWVAMR